MSQAIIDSIVQARVESRKPRLTALMIKWIMEVEKK